MTVISFANMKGGVGKTTLCVNLAFEALLHKKRVLIVDNDPQFNATSSLLSPKRYIDTVIEGKNRSIYDIYERPPRVAGRKTSKAPKAEDFLITTWRFRNTDFRLDLIASRIELYETLRNPSHKEYKLDSFLERFGTEYDYVFIDCPPTPSVLTLSAFAASEYVIIPVKPDFFCTFGLPQFFSTLDDFKQDLHDKHDVRPLGVVLSDVPRQMDGTTRRAIRRVEKALEQSDSNVELLDSRLSHLKVFTKTLWQSSPVHQISGRGTRGKTIAAQELRRLYFEIEQLIDQEQET